jgi:NADH-quinone oxidoreductase subunit M
VIFGTLKPSLARVLDLDAREILVLAPLVVLTIVFGVYPNALLDVSQASVTALIENYHQALGAAQAAALAK